MSSQLTLFGTPQDKPKVEPAAAAEPEQVQAVPAAFGTPTDKPKTRLTKEAKQAVPLKVSKLGLTVEVPPGTPPLCFHCSRPGCTLYSGFVMAPVHEKCHLAFLEEVYRNGAPDWTLLDRAKAKGKGA